MPFNAVLSEFAAASYLTQTRSDEKTGVSKNVAAGRKASGIFGQYTFYMQFQCVYPESPSLY